MKHLWNVELRTRRAESYARAKAMLADIGYYIDDLDLPEALPDPVIEIICDGEVFATVYMTEESGRPGLQIAGLAPAFQIVGTTEQGDLRSIVLERPVV